MPTPTLTKEQNLDKEEEETGWRIFPGNGLLAFECYSPKHFFNFHPGMWFSLGTYYMLKTLGDIHVKCQILWSKGKSEKQKCALGKPLTEVGELPNIYFF
jgi:hypothetical protein